ncbi:Pyrophosphate-energized vacuolar membrane proton pump [Spatholobus suberectus]|nr:Pyrophosphate-energized vacuolar membrane proton pump [Spatholobus suberectus]
MSRWIIANLHVSNPTVANPVKEAGGARFPARMGATLLSELATEIVVPVCAVVGIVFSLVQWHLVSSVKLTPERHGSSSSPRNDNGNNKNGYGDYLIEEEEGINDHNIVVKCADIQSAISEGELSALDLKISLRSASAFSLS